MNMNFEMAKDLHLIGSFFAGDGGGRWLFGGGPDLIIRSDGSISPIQSYAAASGVEYTRGNHVALRLLRADYFNRNTTIDLNGRLVGANLTLQPLGSQQLIRRSAQRFLIPPW